MAKKNFTTQQKKEWQEVQKEKLESVNLQIQNIVNNYEDNPDHIAELLSFSSKFYNYSARNTMLIYSQNRGATFVQSYDAWKKDGHSVQAGQKGMKVFVPVKKTYIQKESGSDQYIALSQATPEQKAAYKSGQLRSNSRTHFSLGNVFDISQTTCPPEDYPQFYHMGYADQDQRQLISGLQNYSSECLATDVSSSPFDSISLRGSFSPFPINDRYHIQLNDRLQDTEALSTLAHELGHAAIHKNMPDSPEFQKELEADCFSIMLESHLGIDLTEGRKKHLADHYKKLQEHNQNLIESKREDEVISFDHIIGDVFKIYSNEIPNIEHHINDQLAHQKINDYQSKNDKTLEDNNMFSEIKKGSFDTIAYYINKPIPDQSDDIMLFPTFEKAFWKYQHLDKTEHTRFGYFDQRDGQMHDLLHFTDQDVLAKPVEELTADKSLRNLYDYDIISSIYKVSGHVREQRIDYLEQLAQEESAFIPHVTIRGSEHPQFKDKDFSLFDAEQKFKECDSNMDGCYKTAFLITYRINGKADSYTGNYIIGGEEGGLVKHIESFVTGELLNSDIDPEFKKSAEWIKDRFLPFLKEHIACSEAEHNIEKQMKITQSDSADIQYYKDLKKHISLCRGILNNQDPGTPHPEEPKLPKHDLSNVKEKAAEATNRFSAKKVKATVATPHKNMGLQK